MYIHTKIGGFWMNQKVIVIFLIGNFRKTKL